MRLAADREVCIGAGMCVLTAPEVFDQDDEDGRVVLLTRTADTAQREVVEAVELCPSGALSITDE